MARLTAAYLLKFHPRDKADIARLAALEEKTAAALLREIILPVVRRRLAKAPHKTRA